MKNPTPWLLTLSARTNPEDHISYPVYGQAQFHRFRTRAEGREFIRTFAAEHGLRIASAVPSRHGVLTETSGDRLSRFSYSLKVVAA